MSAKYCITCMRSLQHADGCAHIDCPQRKPVTAAAVGVLFQVPVHGVLAGAATNGGLRRVPSVSTDDDF